MLYLAAKKQINIIQENIFFVRCGVNIFSAAAFGRFISFMALKHLKRINLII